MMPPDFPTRLAVNNCPHHLGFTSERCICKHLLAAVREALEEAEDRLEELNSESEHDKDYHDGYSQAIHDAIAALREGG